MKRKILHLFVLVLAAYAAQAELKPMLAQAFSSGIEIGELATGEKIYLFGKSEGTEREQQQTAGAILEARQEGRTL